jgi:hypothetical protein
MTTDAKPTTVKPPSKNDVVRTCMAAILSLFPDVSRRRKYQGQTFEERIEAWVLKALDEVQSEFRL